MTKDILRYDLLVQDALKGVVRKVLTDAAREGLPGEHHFYVSFRTGAPGVRISQRLREKYPDEMTIVLQHQFWDLQVHDHTFEVGLSFSGIPERLLVPYDALSGFFDPSVEFGLKFENLAESSVPAAETPAPRPAPALAAVPAPRGAGSEPAVIEPKKPVGRQDSKKTSSASKQPDEEPVALTEDVTAETPSEADGAKVLSLDAFRKKT